MSAFAPAWTINWMRGFSAAKMSRFELTGGGDLLADPLRTRHAADRSQVVLGLRWVAQSVFLHRQVRLDRKRRDEVAISTFVISTNLFRNSS